MAKQVPLSKSLPAIDRKTREFYDNLEEDERKAFSSYLMLRYAASVENNNPELVAYYLLSANKRANKHMFALSRFPKLQWLMVTAVSPDMGTMRHKWLKQKKKEKNPKADVKNALLDLHPAMKEEDAEVWSKLVDKKEFKQYVRDRGE